MHDQPDEHWIITGLRTNSPHAWRALYQHYSEKVWRRVTRLIGDRPADVADLVQDVFLAAVENAGQFDHRRGTLWQWIWGITHNKIASYYRKNNKRAVSFSGLSSESSQRVLDWLDRRVTEPPEVLLTAELVDHVRHVLVALPANQSDLLIAKYIAGVSMRQIAQQQSTTFDAITARLARARAAFRRAFQSDKSSVFQTGERSL